MISEQQIREAVKVVKDPELRKSLVDLGMIRDISVEDDRVTLTLALNILKGPKKDSLVAEIRKVLGHLPGVSSIEVHLTAMSQTDLEQLFPAQALTGLKRVKNLLAVASGKGGVGKTTLAINIALALAREGRRIGLLDADVYGPSVPVMLDLKEHPAWENNMMIPVEKFDLRIISLGMIASSEKQAFIWRGPMVGKAIRQLLGQVLWGELDFLVVDLPPGTGDPSITVAQAIPKGSVLMVTTPQEVALADVRRAIDLFKEFNLNIVGLVENMSYFMCGHTSEPIEIFGGGGGAKLSEESGLPLLGAVPIELKIGLGGDSGTPLMVSAPDSETGHIFQNIARKILEEVDHP
ncbi:MAG: Mrp/NBP35 family ATP-binding protein [Deltaproteobacteria bacterium]|nr:Mrp/NBP35 family ATP-binding protein [Deltaproteobacteria bacterium]